MTRCIFLAGIVILLGINSALAQDDIFEQISEGLEKPKVVQEKKNYFAALGEAVTDKRSYILFKELYLSTRYSFESKRMEGRNSAGLILFGTFSGPEGQIGDMNLQFRAAYYNDQFDHGEKMKREWTDSLTTFAPELHNAYVRLRLLPPMLNIRVGHFYVPYGLQPWIDTHGTLLQGPAMEFIGMDRDWGVAIEGQNDKLEYEVGLTRGSGMDLFERDNNYAVAGKLSTPRIGEHLNDWLGVSFLTGRIFDEEGVDRLRSWNMDEKGDQFANNLVDRWRVGADLQQIIGPARLRFEAAWGKDEKKENVLAEFFEVKYALGKDNRWTTYFQAENLTQDVNRPTIRESDTTVRGGLIYTLSANYNIQLVASRDLSTTFGEEDTWIGILFYAQKGGGIFDW